MLQDRYRQSGRSNKKLVWPDRKTGAGQRATNGRPLYDGWPAVYEYFGDRFGYRPDEVDRLPMYQSAILMGAMSPDHTNVSMTAMDKQRFHGMSKWRKEVFGQGV